MLVLTRKQHEKIQIGDNVTITILRTKGKTVRIGIEAPGSVPVLRGELVAAQDASPGSATDAPQDAPTGRQTPVGEPSAEWASSRLDRDTSVSLQRVPRSRVGSVLPSVLGDKMIDGGGPLRPMLERRAAAEQSRC